MTDDEIMMALECCATALYQPAACNVCPYKEVENCAIQSANDIIDLINRQKSEIDELKKKNAKMFEQWKILSDKTKEHYAELYDNALETQTSEAIKEFAEMIKSDWYDNRYNSPDVDFDDYINNLVKEMTEEKDNA